MQGLQIKDCVDHWQIAGASNPGLYRPITEMSNTDIVPPEEKSRHRVWAGLKPRPEQFCAASNCGLERLSVCHIWLGGDIRFGHGILAGA
ncbi:hypothetical protein DCAR_0312276 [Daucus carota subsp. sativus]|uniref:Uncharacterized protein n=1 Tax=Daucus carota subsp. sativus TaxID=79200 RepID=A0A166AX44_DAUCS|nr:hypothetical protein DCAR_0312276 [Daucus carota subsp. sativus]